MATESSPWEPIIRGEGFTPSEKYLLKLAEKSFLNLWSYPNVFIDKKTSATGDGKELCDLLVVCGDHILIFSDKTISWPSTDSTELSWKRWYKRAIKKSVDQVRGAERWIEKFPNRIFVDSKCTQGIPVSLPPVDRRKVHSIVVALGAAEACEKYRQDGVSSFRVVPSIRDDEHIEGDPTRPFCVGDVDTSGSFVHVLNDATLDIVMKEFDTISDFTSYLEKKEIFLRSGRLGEASGEEELVSHYVRNMNSEGDHDFVFNDDDGEALDIDFGGYSALQVHEQYIQKKKLDEVSYVWDRLIEMFTEHILAGTSIIPDGFPATLSDVELGVRYMTLVPRYMRRSYGEGILDVLERSFGTQRFTRAFIPQTPGLDETAFFFMTLARPPSDKNVEYEQYRALRRNMLEVYSAAFLQRNRQLKRVIGIATEARKPGQGGSEDLILYEQPEWTDDFVEDLEKQKKIYNIMNPENFNEYHHHDDEYPEAPKSKNDVPKANRAERRKLKALRRRRGR